MNNLWNKLVNRQCTTETSCRIQDLGIESCSKNESQSPSARGRSRATPSRTTAKISQTATDKHNTNSPLPAIDVSIATQVRMYVTTIELMLQQIRVEVLLEMQTERKN